MFRALGLGVYGSAFGVWILGFRGFRVWGLDLGLGI